MPYRYDPILLRDLARYIGETVTIYTTSGGMSGTGFTGVLISVNCDVARLLSDIGPAPACALGSCCDRRRGRADNYNDEEGYDERDENARIDCCGRNLGAVVDIPVGRIAAFVHNTLR